MESTQTYCGATHLRGRARSAGDSNDDYDAPAEVRGEGAKEYECTKCGYIMYPAAGREFKFYGDGFTCPGCGAGKEDFVEN